jgi:hypothetical protein
MLYSAVFLLGSAMTTFAFKDGHDLSFDQFAETRGRGRSSDFTERMEGLQPISALSFDRSELCFRGVELVRNLDLFYPCDVLNAVSTDGGIAITDERSECRAFREARREYRLKPFIYF